MSPTEELDALRRAVAELSFLQHLARVTSSALDPDELLGLIIRETCQLMKVEVCSLYMTDGDDLVLTATNGLDPAGVGVARMPLGVGITGTVAATRGVVAVADAPADPRFHWIDGLDQKEFTAMCSVPLVSGDARVVGVLNVQTVERHQWTDDECATLVAIASQLAGVIERSELNRRLQLQLDAEREAVRRWREASQARSDLVSMVSHDVRAPLAIARTYVDALRERLHGESAEVAEVAARIADELGHMERMVGAILSSQALEAGAVSLTRRTVELGPLLRTTCDALARAVPGHRLEVDAGPLPVVSDVDPDFIRQVLQNLVGNAARHAPEGSTVTVRLRRRDGEAEIAVIDTGPGLPAAERAAIFERFRRGGGTARGGTGLGLFVVRTIVDAHGGRVGVDDAPGGGACFWFTLPLDEPPPEARPGGDDPASGAPGTSRGQAV